MQKRWIEFFAMSKKFRVDEAQKQKHLLNYLMKIKYELGEGEISGSVEGQEVEDVFELNWFLLFLSFNYLKNYFDWYFIHRITLTGGMVKLNDKKNSAESR